MRVHAPQAWRIPVAYIYLRIVSYRTGARRRHGVLYSDLLRARWHCPIWRHRRAASGTAGPLGGPSRCTLPVQAHAWRPPLRSISSRTPFTLQEDACGLWQCGSKGFQMILTRKFEVTGHKNPQPPSILRLPPCASALADKPLPYAGAAQPCCARIGHAVNRPLATSSAPPAALAGDGLS